MLDNLIEWEKQHGYKSKYVADKLGLTPSQYSKVKHGTRKPTVEMVEKLKKEFGVKDPIKLLKNHKGGE